MERGKGRGEKRREDAPFASTRGGITSAAPEGKTIRNDEMRGECLQAAVQTPQCERGKSPGRSPPDPPDRETQKTSRAKRRKEEKRGSSHSRPSLPYNTLQ
jgi:hypothetical protein